MNIRKAEHKDLEQLLAIYNYEVVHGVSTLDLHQKTLEEREVWFMEHNVDNHPLIVAVQDERVLGYASLSGYREKEAYRSTVELSVYIDVAYRGKGVATALMEEILQMAAKDPSIHTVVSVITRGNVASEKLHQKFGFQFCGTIREVGIKFGEYRDIDNYCKIMET
ncbi:MAG: GNAT family N-acetyltransferase [Lachnospiraceae bacterium]